MKVNSQIKNQKLVENKHRIIVQAAEPLFVKKGFHETSIREIADAANMSMGLIYKYISSKDDILFLTYKKFHDQYFGALSNLTIQKAKNPIEKIKISMETMLNLFQRDRKKYLFLYTESKFLNPLALKAVLAMETRMLQHFQNIIEEGVQKGLIGVKEPLMAASMILYLLMLDPMRGWSFRKKFSPSLVQRNIIEFCLRAIQA